MFEEEDIQKDQKINMDDLSVEEIEKMIEGHLQEAEKLKVLLKQKKEKLVLAQNFFKKP